MGGLTVMTTGASPDPGPLQAPASSGGPPVSEEHASDEPRCTATTHMDIERTVEAWIRNQFLAEQSFADLGKSFASQLDSMRLARPDVLAQPFDVIRDEGVFKVVDTSMSADDAAWIERELNRAAGLGALADAFNRQVVATYDTHRGVWNDDGSFQASHTFAGATGTSINYEGLARTAGRTIKLVSLLRDVEAAPRPYWLAEEDRYRQGGWLVQKYIQGEITTYSVGNDGLPQVHRETASMLGNGLWI